MYSTSFSVIMPSVSVIMPTFNQQHFLDRAIVSLIEQKYERWELLIINDGSTDSTAEQIQPYLTDRRIRYIENETNRGLGACLNTGIVMAQHPLIAYLPSDDIYYKDHLRSLCALMESNPEVVLAHSGLRHHYNKTSLGTIDGYPLQLVQVMHRRTVDRWVERAELVTDDLDTMFWAKLKGTGQTISSNEVTCEWVDHPHQRHKIIQEPVGGINPYKQYYRVAEPLRFKSTKGNFIDEPEYYKSFHRQETSARGMSGLKILLVGELAYNPERILALEERGHKLYGLWMKNPYWYNYTGPLPFGHVEDIPYENWQASVARIKPDVIYALLNWQAVPFAYEILKNNPGVPFIWHFKEGPFICLEKGTWDMLIALYTLSDAQIYGSPEMRDWFHQFLKNKGCTMVLDGDLPKKDWFTDERSPLLSQIDGEIHTVVPGRPIGLHPQTVQALAQKKIHLHFYGDFTHGQWKAWINKTIMLAPDHLHIHSNCTQESWVKEFSQYDAGWLHFFQSENNGELMRANWDDLNYPARIATLAAAGLPMLQRDNTGHIVATQSLIQKHGIGIFFTSIEDLAGQLYDADLMGKCRENTWEKRTMFTFDAHADKLINFFKQVITQRNEKSPGIDGNISRYLDLSNRTTSPRQHIV